MKFSAFSAVVAISALAGTVANAAPVLFENFDSVPTALSNGWVITNNSSEPGIISWVQGNEGVFTSQSGAPNSYAAANFNSTISGDISNWLITPRIDLQDGEVLSFYTRTEDANQGYADRLQVRLSTNGSSTDVGTTSFSVGDFTTLLTDINSTLSPTGYPTDWTQFNITLSGIGAATGRIAFRYDVADSGELGNNGDYIGLDTVSGTSAAATSVPEPFSIALLGAGLAGAAAMRRRKKAVKA